MMKRTLATLGSARAVISACGGFATAVAGVGAVAVAVLSSAPAYAQASADQAQLIKRGEYLARAGDCIACHTAKGGKPFAGGLAMDTPIGKVYSSNITPDKNTGIGDYTLEDFDRALRHGVAKQGYSLYPAMPYPSYAKVKPSDIKALYAYFMGGVEPVVQENHAVDIPWPLSMRWPLAGWRKMFAPPVVSDDSPVGDDPLARGRYLVEGLGHCSACHTPRKMTMQESALSDDGSTFLSGASIDGYLAKNLRGDVNSGLGRWSEQDITAFLKGGRNEHSAAFGGMAEVVQDSTQYMTDDDLSAIAKYLKSLSPLKPNEVALTYDDTAAKALRSGTDHSNGALVFINNCAACHRSTGLGYKLTFPQLALSSTVNTEDPGSLIRIVLAGGEMPWTTSAPTHYGMPGFEHRLSDQDVADVLTFVRSSWGNKAPAVTTAMVAKARKTLPSANPTKSKEAASEKPVSPLNK